MAKKKDKIQGRDTKVVSFTGTTGTGKSFKAREVAKKLSFNDKVLVVTYSGSGNTWQDCKKIAPTEQELSFKTGWKKIHFVEHEAKDFFPLLEIFKYYRNGILILDDCSQYMQPYWQATEGLKQLCIEHRFRGLDIFFVAHSPMHIPKQCWAYIKFSFIFKCTSKLYKNQMPLDNFDKFLLAQDAVNFKYDAEEIKLKKKPRGIYRYITT